MTENNEIEPVENLMPLRFATREQWLVAAIDALRPMFSAIGAELPRTIRVSVGFKIGTRKGNSRTLGHTYSTRGAKDGANHVFLSPEQDDVAVVLGGLVHELIHVADDCKNGHRGPYAEWFRAIGMAGKVTECVPGETLALELAMIASDLGPYPHAAMTVTRASDRVLVGPEGDENELPIDSGPKPQKGRNVKLVCTDPECGNNCRTTRMWIDRGLSPACPCNGEQMIEPEAAEGASAA
jgi:hypothetical protein